MRHLLCAAAIFPLAACAHSLHEVHASGTSPDVLIGDAPLVEGRAEQFVVMGFVRQTDYVEDARAQLLAACPGKRLEGLTTRYSTDLGFFSWTNHVVMKGFCIPAKSKG